MTIQTIKLGYSRVSTEGGPRPQSLAQQEAALMDFGVSKDNLFGEKISGAKNLIDGRAWNRLEARARELLEAGKAVEICVVDWSRLSRDFYGFMAKVNELAEAGAMFSVPGSYEQFKPTDSMDALRLAIEAFGAQQFREKVSKATSAKLAFLKSQGVTLGPPKKLSEVEEALAVELYRQGWNFSAIARKLSRSRARVVGGQVFGTVKEKELALRIAKISQPTVSKLIKAWLAEGGVA